MVAILPLIFLLLVIAVCTARAAWTAGAADAARGAVEFAVKAAANQYEVEGGSPEIDFERARSAFERVISENLELGRDLNPGQYSAVESRPDYTLIVYNGRGQPPGVEYALRDGTLTESEIAATGFPQVFTLSDGTEAVLESPGVVAEVSVKPRRVFGDMDSLRCKSSAVVVETGYGWKVVLGGVSD
ncbi:MAG: hypothetical protein ACPLTR_12365 [Thermacetogeniaceae bacterium]